MSSKSAPPDPTLSVENFARSLEKPSELLNLARRLLEMREEDAKHLIKDTKRTGFRKIHEHVTSAIDKALEIIAASSASTSGLSERDRGEIALLFIRGQILVNYQEVRDQLSKDLADRVKVMIARVLDELKKENVDRDRLRSMLDSMRTLMDAMAVLVYRYVKRR